MGLLHAMVWEELAWSKSQCMCFIPMAGVWQRTSWLRAGQMAMADADKKNRESAREKEEEGKIVSSILVRE